MKLDIEVERDRLIEMELRPEWCQVGGDLLPQQKLVAALEQLEQAREALELVRGIIADGALTGFNCHSGDWAKRLFASQAVTFEALKQQEVTK